MGVRASISNRSALIMVFLSILSQVIFLGLNVFMIPTLLNKEDFGKWRYLSILLSFAGCAHLGLFDGIYLKWINQDPHARINAKSLWPIVITFSLVSLLIFYLFSLFSDGTDVKSLLAIMLLTICINLFGISSYHIQVFQSAKIVNTFSLSQGLIFFVSIVSLYAFSRLSFESLIVAYFASMLPHVTYIFLARDRWLSNMGVSSNLLIKEGGFRLMIANLGILLLANVDKIILGIWLGKDSAFINYIFASSLIIAAVSVGSSAGNIIRSKDLINTDTRSNLLKIYTAYAVLSYFASHAISVPLSNIFPKYDIDYQPFVLLCLLMFFYSLIIFPEIKTKSVNFGSLLNYLMCALYAIIILLVCTLQRSFLLLSSPWIMAAIVFCASLYCVHRISQGKYIIMHGRSHGTT